MCKCRGSVRNRIATPIESSGILSLSVEQPLDLTSVKSV